METEKEYTMEFPPDIRNYESQVEGQKEKERPLLDYDKHLARLREAKVSKMWHGSAKID